VQEGFPIAGSMSFATILKGIVPLLLTQHNLPTIIPQRAD
jgi:hypothetical protein